MKLKVLIADDEIANLQKLKRTFAGTYTVLEATSGKEALKILETESVAAIITDQKMPSMSGVELLARSLELSFDSVRIILTGYTEVDDLMDAINQGQVHRYITKPWEPNSLREAVRKELESWELRRENDRLSRELEKINDALSRENTQLRQEVDVLRKEPSGLLYQSRPMEQLIKMLDKVVTTDSNVLVQGETGTGKELLARYIHKNSHRKDGQFVAVNCGAVPRDLVESSFFGHRKGSFTGASETRKGYFEQADGGTLFLDEIGDSPLELQVKLLRVIQEGEILPVGEIKPRPVNVRIIASTNRDLLRMVEASTFRQDLFFRLDVFSVRVPPLRDRREDVPLLTDYFLEKISGRERKIIPGLTPETYGLLRSFNWPGNVRELENEIERLVILSEPGRFIPPDLLSDHIRYAFRQSPVKGSLRDQMASLEKKLILDALKTHQDNKSIAAKALGITRQTIISKLKEYQGVD
ncbi:MAG: sigma-54 dependent transcriptional regulator [Acidobacteriota bacterium]